MMIKSVVLTLIVVVGSLHGLGTITRVSLQPSDCENCGMTALGQVRQHDHDIISIIVNIVIRSTSRSAEAPVNPAVASSTLQTLIV